ncbi:MAG: GNAT family N-acetyltransferase [Chloroflexota bacterium]|nr:GNAT family N-acetyltransferase [Chloroflexota bacterium]
MINTTPQTHGIPHASHAATNTAAHPAPSGLRHDTPLSARPNGHVPSSPLSPTHPLHHPDLWKTGRYFLHYNAHDAQHMQVIITNTQPEHAAALGAMQRTIFPTLPDSELFTEAKYRKHIELFPQGQFVVLVYKDGAWLPVGSSSTYRTTFDFDHYDHTYDEAIAGGWLTCHERSGDWLYGVDMAMHPDYRGLRIGRRLYDARQALVQHLNLRGEIAGGLMPHYELHRKDLSVAQYALRVWQGKLYDPTLTMQIRNGFRIRALLYNHIGDPRSDNTATLLVRDNTHYDMH